MLVGEYFYYFNRVGKTCPPQVAPFPSWDPEPCGSKKSGSVELLVSAS